ncbi:triacylglycerol lipase OBL1-like [Tripterygium wilfordii]|uniref:triacylglycerol lipase OBL1-like n=1 Tax=Tripterygium wilfordii TaxID=458696 RepID=UPI0018F860F7|nr:triacylglycerol lipase OBL1-like [Tripterygium wilfordii]
MVLRPEEVSVVDLIRFLWNQNLKRLAFLEYPTGKEENVRRTWIIFISLLGQKILQSTTKPMSFFGSVFEMWLNLVSSNRNIAVLLLNFFRGKVVKPTRSSATFMSAFGFLDKRVNLDHNIKPGDSRYHGALAMMASKISYENKAFVESTVKDCWKMELLEYKDYWNDFQRKHTTQAFMLHDKSTDPDMIVVAFRGTEIFDADAWCTDIDISWYELPGIGKIHGGFMKALGLVMYQGWPLEVVDHEQHSNGGDRPLAYYSIRQKLREMLKVKNNRTRFILTGHSLGGALAVLFPAILALHEETWLLERLEGVFTFGQPRVGDEEFRVFMKRQLDKYGFRYLRFVYCNDVIPRSPTDDSTFLFKHFGTCLYYNSCYKGKIVEEEPHKNYVSLLATIPRMINALWELIRSFIIRYRKGPEYAEGWLLILVRLVGVALPGLSAHNPQDYVNLTRLGSPEIYTQLKENRDSGEIQIEHVN